MDCPQCSFSNPPGAVLCKKCNTPFEVEEATIAERETEDWSFREPVRGVESVRVSSSGLQPGNILGDRYEVLQLLGEGGMGAVYKAKDRELNRIVALKVILPELARQPEIHQRFKQELILARQITHKNVIRIFDLGDAEGTKFISMEYIEGQDLKTLLRQKGKFSPEEAVAIIQQVCRALYAAHEKGVIHRDLKPQNIMMEKHGNVLVMDFGIARSMEAPGVTRTGALIGTFEYMSPEQARGEKVDARSDLFTLGIIFYELLTGKSPFQADTPTATLLKRIQEQVVPPVEVDPAVPRFLSEVVVKCLQIDPELRYQSAAEILQDLEARRAPRSGAAAALLPPRLRLATVTSKRIAAGLGVVLLALAGFVFRDNFFPDSFGKPSTSKEPISLAILPFRNASGDQTLDWLGPSLAEMLRTDIGQSSHLRTVSSDRLYQILQDLRIAPDSHLDPATLRRLAEFSNAGTLVWGQYLKLGEKIRIDATIYDLKRQREIPLKAEAAQEEDLLDVIGQLAQSIQENLSLSSDIVEELRATAFRPSSSSIQALRYYNKGLQLGRQGNHLEAAKRFEASIEVDPEFALAYSMLGQTYANLGYDDQAEQSSRKAVDRSEELPSQEKYLVQANHAWILNDYEKAIEAYENLAKVSPTDADVHFNLAGLYEDTGSFDRARDHYAKVLKYDPKYGDALFAMGRVEFYRENPQGSLEYFNRGLSLAIQLENEEAKATFLNAVGNAYKLLNKSQEALKNFQEALAIRRRLDHKRGMASSLGNMAQMQADLGHPDDALASYKEALQLRREIGDKSGIGDSLIDLGTLHQDSGRYEEALELYKQALRLQREVGNENYQALCLNNIGSIYLFQGQYGDALTYFERALQLREKSATPGEIAETLHNLGETSSKMAEYDQALSFYLRALELWRNAGDKRGEAIESYSMGSVFGLQGRFGAALKSKQEALKMFRELQDRSFWLGEILSGYGQALSQLGRFDEAEKPLEEALNLARALQNDALVAQILNFQGDSFFYRGDFKSAGTLFEQALQVASETTDRHLILLSKVNLAKMEIRGGRPRTTASAMQKLMQESESLGFKYLQTECSLYLAQALLNAKDYSRAQRALEAARLQSEKMSLQELLAKSNYLLARTLRLTGKEAEARRHYQQALRILEEMRQEAGNNDLIKRADLAPLYTESTRWSAAPPS